MNSKNLTTFSLCAIAGGILFLWLGLAAKRSRAIMAEQGISVPGTVTGGHINNGSKGKRNYYLEVRWSANQGHLANESFKVTNPFYSAHVNVDKSVRVSEVELRYLPDHPETAIVVGGTSDNGGMEWLGGILALLGGFGICRRFLRKAASN
jgi:hypothetical protein